MHGVYSPLSRDELNDMRRAMPTGTETEIRLCYALTSREGTLRRLYQAVMATPLEGTELREAMSETERVLGLTP